MQSSFVTWNEGEAQELLRMRRDLEHLAERNAILEEQQQVEMDAVLGRRVRELEFNARLSSADASAEAKAEAAAESRESKPPRAWTVLAGTRCPACRPASTTSAGRRNCRKHSTR